MDPPPDARGLPSGRLHRKVRFPSRKSGSNEVAPPSKSVDRRYRFHRSQARPAKLSLNLSTSPVGPGVCPRMAFLSLPSRSRTPHGLGPLVGPGESRCKEKAPGTDQSPRGPHRNLKSFLAGNQDPRLPRPRRRSQERSDPVGPERPNHPAVARRTS